MLIPSALIWYPFFKVYEKQLIAKEAAVEAEEKRAAVSNQGNAPMQPVKPEKEV